MNAILVETPVGSKLINLEAVRNITLFKNFVTIEYDQSHHKDSTKAFGYSDEISFDSEESAHCFFVRITGSSPHVRIIASTKTKLTPDFLQHFFNMYCDGLDVGVAGKAVFISDLTKLLHENFFGFRDISEGDFEVAMREWAKEKYPEGSFMFKEGVFCLY